MQPKPVEHTGESSLRFVFDHTMVSFRLTEDVTFAQIARTLDELSFQRHGSPVIIDIVPASAEDGSAQRIERRPDLGIYWPNVIALRALAK